MEFMDVCLNVFMFVVVGNFFFSMECNRGKGIVRSAHIFVLFLDGIMWTRNTARYAILFFFSIFTLRYEPFHKSFVVFPSPRQHRISNGYNRNKTKKKHFLFLPLLDAAPRGSRDVSLWNADH